MKVCIGILSVGRSYLAEFERLFKPSVSAYCARNGYDLKIFTDYIDPVRKHPHTISFQKCLIPDQLREYDLVVVMDADIFVEQHAPPIHLLELHEKIGIVDEIAQSSSEQYKTMVNIGFADHAKAYYAKVGLELDTGRILNTGLILCEPAKHADYLKSIYETYVAGSINNPRGFHYEQACIGYKLQTDNTYELIPNVWNFIYVHHQLTRQPLRAYFVHFAGLRGSERESALSRHTFKGGLRWGIKK
jgi:hypothetical protein